MRFTKRVRFSIVIMATLMTLAVVAAVALFWVSLPEGETIAAALTYRTISWRLSLYARKAMGGVADLSWYELWEMTRVRGGYGLQAFAVEGQTLDVSVANPRTTDEDLQDGDRLFTEHCSVCHGADATGWHGGPPLNRSGLKHGDSDFAIYKVVRDGVPGTSMVSVNLDTLDRWKIVGYIRALLLRGPDDVGSHPTHLNIHVSADRLRAAGTEADEWLTYSGSLDGRRYVSAAEITPANVSQLRLRWVRQFDANEGRIEATPIVVDGVVFITVPPSKVVALDSKSGHIIWTYSHKLPADLPLCCGYVNRGLAVLGHTLFFGALDGYLIAIDSNTGREMWTTKVADASAGFTLTGAPLVADQLAIVGVAGGEFGIRGYLAAYDTATGRERWKFFTVPGPGESGHETWGNDAWLTGGGPTWVTRSYDPSLDLVYWGVGNPAPDFSGVDRPGDNLFTDSVLALQASSGKLVWYFQFTPHDEHDWDSTQTPILADLMVNGVSRRVICWANRNGFYYVLDRVTGEFLAGAAFVDQNWAKGLDSKGRAIPEDKSHTASAGRPIKPGVAGGTNWQTAAFDERRGLMFVPATEGAGTFTRSPDPNRGDRGLLLGSHGSMSDPPLTVVRALDAVSGEKKWERFAPSANAFALGFSGLLSTGGGLVFGAAGGDVFALDSDSGRELWRVPLGGNTLAPPISFVADGHQVIAVSAGRSLFAFGLPP